MKQKSSLDEIFVSKNGVDENMLRDVLIRYVRIEKESMTLIPTPEYEKLQEKQKVLICLLSRKAMRLRNVVAHDHMSPTEIGEVSGVKMGTVRPAVRSYLKANLLRKDEEGYFIPDYALERVKKEVSEP